MSENPISRRGPRDVPDRRLGVAAPARQPIGAALAVNMVGMWPDPSARLREVAGLLPTGRRIAVVSQSRCPGATVSEAAARELTAAGFEDMRSGMLGLDPPVACVLGRVAGTR
ncbi:hypothetical protein ILP97_23880 [Amycolatopsis sp. H6(2020)]|nr:hypothetical protein [Amycolatopsis sp. H6(2020)]